MSALATWVEETLPGILLLVMVLLVSVAVTMRYVFAAPLMFANELALVLFVWQVMLSVAGAARRRLHIAIELARKRLPLQLQNGADLVVSLLLLVLSVTLAVLGWQFTAGARRTLYSLGLSWRWVYLAVPVGFALLSVHFATDVLAAIRALRRGGRPASGSSVDRLAALEGAVVRDDPPEVRDGGEEGEP